MGLKDDFLKIVFSCCNFSPFCTLHGVDLGIGCERLKGNPLSKDIVESKTQGGTFTVGVLRSKIGLKAFLRRCVFRNP